VVSPRLREVGDAALQLEIDSRVPPTVIDVDASRRAAVIAKAVSERRLAGVRDVVPTLRTVTVSFDPLTTDMIAVEAALRESAALPADALRPAVHEVPVAYGGEGGPDLDEVAAFAGCSPSEVVQRHMSWTYRVLMLGFMPGFAYLGTVPDTIAAPRRATPRVRVPAGSVGIAGQQTGIYPRESPGGWQIIGRTSVRPFDARRSSPVLFAPGDKVRFVPVRDIGPAVNDASMPAAAVADDGTRGYVTVLRPGALTTVQDRGRWGYQALGVPASGAMDTVSHRLANVVVGNGPEAATVEVTCLGPELLMEDDTLIGLAGADLGATLDGAPVDRHAPVRCPAGSVLRFGERRSGARAYIGFGGGVRVAEVLGSRSTGVSAGLGGFGGRALRAGDRLPVGQAPRLRTRPVASWPADFRRDATLRVLPGPQAAHFDQNALAALERVRFEVSPDADRTGYRLRGGPATPSTTGGAMISDAAFFGGIQIPPSGHPILLMADRPTTGGYPQIAIVITADLPRAAQLAPGDTVSFALCSRADAIAALVAQEGRMLGLQ
jgi:KipI family sensor histidine kinase inhibitor